MRRVTESRTPWAMRMPRRSPLWTWPCGRAARLSREAALRSALHPHAPRVHTPGPGLQPPRSPRAHPGPCLPVPRSPCAPGPVSSPHAPCAHPGPCLQPHAPRVHTQRPCLSPHSPMCTTPRHPHHAAARHPCAASRTRVAVRAPQSAPEPQLHERRAQKVRGGWTGEVVRVQEPCVWGACRPEGDWAGG